MKLDLDFTNEEIALMVNALWRSYGILLQSNPNDFERKAYAELAVKITHFMGIV